MMPVLHQQCLCLLLDVPLPSHASFASFHAPCAVWWWWWWCRDVFSAGASMYGVADVELLAKDTHKFESR